MDYSDLWRDEHQDSNIQISVHLFGDRNRTVALLPPAIPMFEDDIDVAPWKLDGRVREAIM